MISSTNNNSFTLSSLELGDFRVLLEAAEHDEEVLPAAFLSLFSSDFSGMFLDVSH